VIYWERRPVQLDADEQSLYDLTFRPVRPRDFVSLLMVGEWRDAAPGERLLTAGQRADAIFVAISGDLEFRKEDTVIGRLKPGQTVGLALAFTEEPSAVDAQFLTAGRYVKFPIAGLRRF